jgi:hypothetical protein
MASEDQAFRDLEVLLDEQSRRWQQGERPLVENYLAQQPTLQHDAEAEQAMAWLKKAVAAGWKDGAHIEKDKDLDAPARPGGFQEAAGGAEGRTGEAEVDSPKIRPLPIAAAPGFGGKGFLCDMACKQLQTR